jgi:hypothetical protein
MITRSEAGVIASGTLLFLALVGLVLPKLLQRRTRDWPKTSALIHSADMEVMKLDENTDIMLPCFTFSYVVAGENHSGRFSLFTDGEKEGESIARKMVQRTIQIQYNPRRPSAWYLPEKTIEGYEVEQKMSQHLMENLYPKD